MQQPPTESQISPVCLKVIAQGLCQVVIVVFQADRRVCRRRGKGDDAGEVVSAAKEVELDAGEYGEQGESVDEGERPRNSWTSLEMTFRSTGPRWNVHVILTSFHSCVLFCFTRGCRSASPDSAIWLACTYPSLWKLERLLRSSSVTLGDTEVMSEPLASPGFSRASLSARFFCSSFVSSSTGSASMISSVAVGSKARTV